MSESALVLGGGGVTGVAWMVGLLAGLAEAGVDLRTADVIVGTSAGSVVGAQITTVESLEKLYERQLLGFGSEVSSKLGLGSLFRFAVVAVTSRNEQKALARIGALALAAPTMPAAERRSIIAGRLPVHEWPDRRLLITAILADTGEFVVLDRDSGASLVDAVAASCAVPCVWPPAIVDGRPYIDGGMRSPANVDVAKDCERVVVLAPTTQALRRNMTPAAQVAALSGSARMLLITPDEAARQAIGPNVLDPARRAPSARAGRSQAAMVAEQVARVWSSDLDGVDAGSE
jgi:NTE family protein